MQFQNLLTFILEMVDTLVARQCFNSLNKSDSFWILRMSTLSTSAFTLTANEPGSSSCSAEEHKSHKYTGVSECCIFQAITSEFSCVIGQDAFAFNESLVVHIRVPLNTNG